MTLLVDDVHRFTRRSRFKGPLHFRYKVLLAKISDMEVLKSGFFCTCGSMKQ